jgi:hypothetical protein
MKVMLCKVRFSMVNIPKSQTNGRKYPLRTCLSVSCVIVASPLPPTV